MKFAQVNASIDRQYDSMATANSLHLAKNLTAQSVRAEIRRQALKSDSAVINKTVNIFEDHIHNRNKIVIFFGDFGKIFLAEVGDAIVNSTAVV